MKHQAALACLALAFATTFAEARILGQAHAEIRLVDGKVLTQVTPMSYSEQQQSVVIAVDRTLSMVPLDRFPVDMRNQILRDHEGDRVRLASNVVPTIVRPSSAVMPNPSPSSTENSFDRLIRRASDEAADELRFSLQQSHGRISSVDCKIRSAEQVPGWSQIRVDGIASYSVWNHDKRDYVWHSGKFEVIFDVVDGEKLRPATVTFDGISRRVDR